MSNPPESERPESAIDEAAEAGHGDMHDQAPDPSAGDQASPTEDSGEPNTDTEPADSGAPAGPVDSGEDENHGAPGEDSGGEEPDGDVRHGSGDPHQDAPDQDSTEGQDSGEPAAEQADPEPATEVIAAPPADEPATEVIDPSGLAEPPQPERPQRRFTAPSSFDAAGTQRIDTPPDPATEIIATAPAQGMKTAAPQHIPPRGEAPKPPAVVHRSWGWVIALLLVIAALVAVAVLGTVLLTRDNSTRVSEEDRVRETIEKFDVAIQSGDLATLRSITCGATLDSYVKYTDAEWREIHSRVAAAKQYPVVASIDQIVINGDHAEANVTAFMAHAPQTRSTRSFDLQYRDEQWKICQMSQ
jgi:hypothetical protein